MLTKIFGLIMAAGVLFTSIAMIIMGGKWQKIEQSAYAGNKRPWWFLLLSFLLVSFYIVTLLNFFNNEKTIAGWLLMLVIPIGWLIKAVLITFNPKGRKKVSSISGDKAWIRIGLARLALVAVLVLLVYLV